MLPRTEILNRIEFLMWLIQLKRDNFVCKTNISIKLKWIPSQVCTWRQKNSCNNSEPKAIKYAHKSTFMKGHRRVFLSTLLITAIFEEYSPHVCNSWSIVFIFPKWWAKYEGESWKQNKIYSSVSSYLQHRCRQKKRILRIYKYKYTGKVCLMAHVCINYRDNSRAY